MDKKCKVVMLPTNQKARLMIDKHGELQSTPHYCESKTFHAQMKTPQHLYILSDDEIKEGDFVYTHNQQINRVGKFTSLAGFESHMIEPKESDVTKGKFYTYCGINYSQYCKKIIATTDKLNTYFEIANTYDASDDRYLSQPSQSFIEKYVSEYNKGNVITEVMVEYEERDINPYSPTWEKDYERYGLMHKKNMQLFLKINSKDNTITIKKIKDSWNRDEVIDILKTFGFAFTTLTSNDLHNWIEKNFK